MKTNNYDISSSGVNIEMEINYDEDAEYANREDNIEIIENSFMLYTRAGEIKVADIFDSALPLINFTAYLYDLSIDKVTSLIEEEGIDCEYCIEDDDFYNCLQEYFLGMDIFGKGKFAIEYIPPIYNKYNIVIDYIPLAYSNVIIPYKDKEDLENIRQQIDIIFSETVLRIVVTINGVRHDIFVDYACYYDKKALIKELLSYYDFKNLDKELNKLLPDSLYHFGRL